MELLECEVESTATRSEQDAPATGHAPLPKTRRWIMSCSAQQLTLLWQRNGGNRVLACTVVVFIYQLAPTPDDTVSAFAFSRNLNLSSALLAF